MAVSTREVLRCLVEGLQWLKGQGAAVRVAGWSRAAENARGVPIRSATLSPRVRRGVVSPW